MSFTSDLVAHLKTDTDITDVVGSGASARIRPMVLHQNETLPAIVLDDVSGSSFSNLAGASGHASTMVEIDAVATTKAAAESLRESIRKAIQNHRGAMGDVFVSGWSSVGRSSAYEAPTDGKAVGIYRAVLTAECHHSEDAT